MTNILLVMVAIAAFLPALLARHHLIVHKRLFAVAIVIGVLKPISTVLIPFAFREDGFGTAMDNYLLLVLTYYLLLLISYRIAIAVISTRRHIVLAQYLQRKPYKYLAIAAAIILFSVLVLSSGGTFLTNPREGYQYYREGVGFIWAFYILAVGLAYFIYLVIAPPTLFKVLAFSVAMFFTGSKQLILEVLIKSYLVYTWKGLKIKKTHLIVAGFFFVLLMLKLFDQFRAEGGFMSRVGEYFDFMYHASLVFNDYEAGSLKFQYGEIFLSSFWGYVPRALYPAKPYAYGSTYLVEMYFPGLAETGHTPSFGMLTAEFVDFGWLAPFFAIILNAGTIIQILSIVIVCAKNSLKQTWKIGALAFVFIPGFGFHLPFFMSIAIAYLVLPKLIKRQVS